MATPDDFASTTDWEREVGVQVKRARLTLDLGQADLARNANVSLGAVKGLEHGKGSTLKTFVRVARALGKQDWLAGLEPEPELGPFDLLQLREGRKAPQRASGQRASGQRASGQRNSGGTNPADGSPS
jgi:transcriptional regulator with XRE-family HTH domain